MVLVFQLPVLIYAQTCTRCTTPDTVGAFTDHTFMPDSGCFHGIPTVDDTFALLRGTWVLTCGGSNAWATHNALVRQLNPSAYPWRDERYDGTSRIWPEYADEVWDVGTDGSYELLHSIYVCQGDANQPCEPGTSAWHTQIGNLSTALTSQQVPSFSASAVRITYGHGKLFTRCSSYFDDMGTAANGWALATKMAWVQSGVWYLNGYDDSVGPETYGPNLRAFLLNQSSACSSASMSCFISTIPCAALNSHDLARPCAARVWVPVAVHIRTMAAPVWLSVAGCVDACTRCRCVDISATTLDLYGLNKWIACEKVATGGASVTADINRLTRGILTEPPFSASFTLVDVTALLSAKPQEAPGHTGPLLSLWTFWVMFNALPAADGVFGLAGGAATCPETVSFDDGCLVYPQATAATPPCEPPHVVLIWSSLAARLGEAGGGGGAGG